jgi:TIGR03118 family protein
MRPRIVTLCAAALVLGITGTVPAHATTQSKSGRSEASNSGTRITRYAELPLVSSLSGKAPITDPKLVNPWGIAIGKELWVSNAGTGTATVYTGGVGSIKKAPTEVAIPGGTPTGQVVNTTEDFVVKGKNGKGPATFIFASPSGAITGWNAEADPKNAIIAAFTRHADYKGLALMETNRGNFLLAADFANNRIDVFDADFQKVRLGRRAFRDPLLPKNYNAYNVEIVGDAVAVAYALRDPRTGKSVAGRGKGFVSLFTPSGRFVRRLVSRGHLNAPWAMILAPKKFGSFSNALLVGNFGDGQVNAYHPRTGRHLGTLRLPNGKPVAIEGLWDLERGTPEIGGEDAVWYSAGIQKAQHGLLGVLRPARKGDPTGASSAPGGGGGY